MVLRNWYKALTAEMYNKYNNNDARGKNTSGYDAYFTGSSSSGGVYSYTSLTLACDPSQISSNNYSPLMSNVRTNYGYGGVVFGTGDTAPTFDDYKLSGDLVTTMSASASVVVTTEDDGYTYVATYTIANTGSADITIKEVGLILQGRSNSSFLIERTVLDSPLTISVGGVGQLVYTIRMNYPT
jgi:hypothetical protein